MRSVSSNGLAKLATSLGTEPINIIEIRWTAGGTTSSYSDRDISPGIQGRILELGNLDNTVKVSDGGENQAITVKMSDTDGSIKAILDQNDIHKRPCWVYQWFDGIALSDKFLLFKGQINSPITWNEGERAVTFDIISKIEDAEIGFSVDEGNFPNPPYELIGKPWPLCFGTVVNVQHLAATPVGQTVRAEAEVTEVDGRRVAFKVSAHDECEEIGRGTHERIVIDLKRFGARLAAKAG